MHGPSNNSASDMQEMPMNTSVPNAANSKTAHYRVAIIGSGFSGLGMAIKLKQAGENNFIVFEKDSGVGGTWQVNSYPGCACDVQSHLYSYSFEPNPNWTRMFATQPEIRGYLQHCASKYNVMPHVRLNNAIEHLRWNEQEQHWHLQDANGIHYTANIVVSGMGGLSKPALPEIRGLDKFAGKVFHSQQWDHAYDFRGKRVAVIGTGASAIQFVPQIQPKVAHLDLYQRTPPWILPKPDRPISGLERSLFARIPALQKLWRGLIYSQLETRVLGFAVSPKVMLLPQTIAKHHIYTRIKDPILRKKVTPDYRFGCKRVLISDDYYPALTQKNVDVITAGIREITETSVITNDGTRRDVDAVILGTGFRVSDLVARGMLFGRNGLDITDIWKNGPSAYKGICVTGFPNLFFLMGPNTGLGHSSMVYMIESQIHYVMDAVARMQQNGWQSVDVKPDLQEHYNRDIQGGLGHSVWNAGGCSSWYLHPVTGRNTALWPGFTFNYRATTKHFDASAYQISSGATSTIKT
jgi:cation diffusion facilitator CzcD-associated flavoprotein CzcO